MAGEPQTGTPQQGAIVKIQLPAAETWPPEMDGNMRSWGRGGERPEAVVAARSTGRDLEMEAGG